MGIVKFDKILKLEIAAIFALKLGIGCVKTDWNKSNGVTVDYVDPANIVYSHTDSPHFDDMYYIGEVKTLPINELVRQFPNLSHEDIEELSQSSKRNTRRQYKP